MKRKEVPGTPPEPKSSPWKSKPKMEQLPLLEDEHKEGEPIPGEKYKSALYLSTPYYWVFIEKQEGQYVLHKLGYNKDQKDIHKVRPDIFRELFRPAK